MAFSIEVSPEFEDDYRRKCRKNAAFRLAVENKITQVAQNPLHYKPLQAPLQGVRRVHVQSSFVILFEAIEKTKTLRLLALKHHDEAYE